MRINKSPRRLSAIGFAFIAIGLAETVVKTGGSHPRSLAPVGIVFIALGISFTVRARRVRT